MEKFDKLYNEVMEMLYWAESQRHINIQQRDLLIDNIIKIKESIEQDKN